MIALLPLAADKSVGSQLLQLAVEGLGVGLGVTFAFSLGLVGTIRAADARSGSRGAAVVGWSVVALLAFAAFTAAIVLAIHVVTNK